MGWFSRKAKKALEAYYKNTPEDAEQAEKERAAKEERGRLRFDLEKLLDKYDMSDLSDFCSKYLGEAPASREILKDGTERELKPNRHTFVNFILEYYDKGQLRAEQIKDFSLKHRIVTPSFFANETESKVGNENELNDILDVIDEKFKPEIIIDEKELQGQLAVFLKAMYPGRKIEREVTTKRGDKIDILIDDNYVLELKVPSGKDSLRSLSAQIEEYMEEFPLLAVVIADKSDLVSDQDDSEFYDPDLEKGLTKRIIEYADKYKVKYGAKTLIFSVKKRSKK
jgi:hypothetical protein